MKSIIPLTTTVFLFAGSTVWADNVDAVVYLQGESNLIVARRMLEEYLTTGKPESNKSQLVKMQLAGESALSTVLDSILSIKSDKEDGPQQRRLDWSLELLYRIALRTFYENTQLSPPGRADIGRKLNLVFQSFKNSQNVVATQKATKITMIYDMLKLWSGNEFWFLAPKAGSIEGLTRFHSNIVSIVPELSVNEVKEIEDNIRKISNKELLPHITLYQIGRATENDIIELFRQYSIKFSQAFQAAAVSDRFSQEQLSPAFYRDYEDVRMMDFYNEILKHLRLGLDRHHAVIRNAFEYIRGATERADARSGHKSSRQLFFDLMQSNQEDFFKVDVIQELASNSFQHGEFVLPQVRKSENPAQVAMIEGRPTGTKPSFFGNGTVVSLDQFRAKRMACTLTHTNNNK